jgi:hypothetical protein
MCRASAPRPFAYFASGRLPVIRTTPCSSQSAARTPRVSCGAGRLHSTNSAADDLGAIQFVARLISNGLRSGSHSPVRGRLEIRSRCMAGSPQRLHGGRRSPPSKGCSSFRLSGPSAPAFRQVRMDSGLETTCSTSRHTRRCTTRPHFQPIHRVQTATGHAQSCRLASLAAVPSEERRVR